MMRRKIYFCLGLVLLSACQEKAIYENESFSMYADRIVQGDYTGMAESPYRIVSNLVGVVYVWER